MPGLSPLARGNPYTLFPVAMYQRSIPAGAGEPLSCLLSISSCRVYPRWRGGTLVREILASQIGGLSPLARGNLLTAGIAQSKNGSIPAGAGEPADGGHRSIQERVYPRWRGGTSGRSGR